MKTHRYALFAVAVSLAVCGAEPLARAQSSCAGECCNLTARPDCICACNGVGCGLPENNIDECGHTYPFPAGFTCGTCPGGYACEDLGEGPACYAYNACAMAKVFGWCGTYVDPTLNQQVTCNGICSASQACVAQGAGDPNLCETTCASVNAQCGSLANGVGGTLNCGSCPAGQVCGANVANQCGVTCASAGAQCGVIANGAGGSLNCGTCSGSEVCTTAHACCTPSFTCAANPGKCGAFADGCGDTVTCGCTGGAECSNGSCCTPLTCAQVNGEGLCGAQPDGCGGTVQCPPLEGSACSSAGTIEACTPGSCTALGVSCGTIPNGNCYNEALTCGFCPQGSGCQRGKCVVGAVNAPAVPPSANAMLAGVFAVFGMAFLGRRRRSGAEGR